MGSLLQVGAPARQKTITTGEAERATGSPELPGGPRLRWVKYGASVVVLAMLAGQATMFSSWGRWSRAWPFLPYYMYDRSHQPPVQTTLKTLYVVNTQGRARKMTWERLGMDWFNLQLTYIPAIQHDNPAVMAQIAKRFTRTKGAPSVAGFRVETEVVKLKSGKMVHQDHWQKIMWHHHPGSAR